MEIFQKQNKKELNEKIVAIRFNQNRYLELKEEASKQNIPVSSLIKTLIYQRLKNENEVSN